MISDTPNAAIPILEPAAPPAPERSKESGAIGHSALKRLDWLFFLGVIALYVPTVINAAKAWIANDNYAHGFFVFPVSAAMLWIQRDQLKAAARRPSAWGIPILVLGLCMKLGADLVQLRYIAMWSLVPTLAGGILALYGPAIWRLSQFSVYFLLFGAPLPNAVLQPLTTWIQGISTAGAANAMSTLGYPVMRHGNLIEIPGLTLEVADVCSGFHKLISLLAFSAVYAYMFPVALWKKLLLYAATVPIAIFCNVMRISGLIAVGVSGGEHLVHVFHDSAEFVAIGVAFVLFTSFGRVLGCKTIRF